jgi:hypothetical protein
MGEGIIMTKARLVCLLLFASLSPAGAEDSPWVFTSQPPAPPLSALGASAATGTGWTQTPASRTLTDGALRRVVLARLRPEMPLFQTPSLISTGFSGQIYQRPILPAAAREAARSDPAYQFIDLDGVVASLTNIDHYGFAPNGAEVTRPALDRIYAREVGQVFGATADDAAAPNLFLTATSAYGLQIIGPDRNDDHQPDRLHQGEPQARWMPGQWGFDPLSGPDSVWKVDGATGKISLFATLTTQGTRNTGPALGNIAFDAAHQQLFVSDLQSGLIHRLDLQGQDLDQFDHGLIARSREGLAPRADDPARRTAITDFAFDPQAPETWGFAEPQRRVWGLALQGDRLYYAVAQGKTPRPEVWSVGLDPTGQPTPDARWELSLDPKAPDFEISDIGFTAEGAMLLAQRGPRAPAFDYSSFTQDGSAEVLRYTPTPTGWSDAAQHYAVGFAAALTNTTGGLALGPAYDAQGRLDAADCRGTLWTSGENLRNAAALAPQLAAGGMLGVDGAQAQPVALLYDQNAPPWVSYQTDFDALYPSVPQTGHIGDVAVLGCPEAAKAKPQACATSAVALHCDAETGLYVADIAVKTRTALPPARVKLSDPSGQILSLPQDLAFAKRLSVPVTGLGPKQIGQISICSYDSSADGAPYDCCTTTVSFETPEAICKKVVK